jgi:AcrR family transcriptional regulator
VSKKRLTPEEGKRPPGRPRSERARRAILSSTLKFLELKGNGFDDLAIEHVAAEAGVGKATVYRWWPNKAALVADAFASSVDTKLHFPDSGTVVGDLSRQMQQVIQMLRSRRGQVVSVILGAGQSDSTLLRAFREQFLKPRRAEAYQMLRRAMQRGELPPDLDMDLMLDSLYGAIYFRFLIGHDTLTPEIITDLCELVLFGASRKQRRGGNARPSRLIAESATAELQVRGRKAAGDGR